MVTYQMYCNQNALHPICSFHREPGENFCECGRPARIHDSDHPHPSRPNNLCSGYRRMTPPDMPTHEVSIPAATALAGIVSMQPSEYESINHPSHYGGDSTYEAIKVIRAWSLNFNLGNTIKYICRAGKKPDVPPLEDLKKALWYLQDEIKFLESQQPPVPA